MKNTKTDTKGRKYQITINNPQDYNINHETINTIMKEFKWIYYCFCDEIGENKTPHIHLFFVCKNAVLFSKVKKLFPTAHIESAIGSCQENRDYIRKEGKYLNSDKKETNLIDTFEEYGEMPLETAVKNETVSEQVLNLILEGYSNADIIRKFPSYATKIPHLNNTRHIFLKDANKDSSRNLEIIYIFGKTGTGKTRYVMDKYGYSNVCKVSDYAHPFDNYNEQDILLLDEFRSSISIGAMLQYLDRYPCDLPARYADKVALYTKVYIVSNIDLKEQFIDTQLNDKETWNAFVRRITAIYEFVIPENDNDLPFTAENEAVTIEHSKDEYIIK